MTLHETEHSVVVDAPPKVVFDLVADVTLWPRIFPPTIHVEHLDRDASQETIRLWATANGQVKTWTSRRTLDPAGTRVGFRQQVSQPPVAAMGGEWIIEPLGPGQVRVRLTHDYRAVDDDPEAVAWIAAAVDRNSGAELEALKRAAEQPQDLAFSFEDSVHVDGPIEAAYAFVHEAGRWAERLPHVARVDLSEEVENTQILEMDTRTADGSVHTTRSVRICFPGEKIVYKQLRTPALLTAHTGRWTFTRDGSGGPGGTVTSGHTVEIAPAAVTTVLGAGATVEDARAFVRKALGANSRATLAHAATHARSAAR
ncbi:aromatase/bifunctional aromatase (cyclase/dehydratase) [Streptosporangium becharense]|uniref:Aromatase/bifunctional aromatase (Cyclase/dehydratase) n=1 Tax=Streptosporangium becharense TaxID=1816182 RepID=A0A7W9IMN3_9ACTN|nr:aromatase/cyclase [Streptosporangium becharense]MBB2910432.1 aromatase/bifunctional aromatase (cyclase/dehydratase) [Streptosporangium becharense]MBB5823175.1 aromatase/bifunctional aromatase (cyclase/dehydratase) [Streptosporangium becharense]